MHSQGALLVIALSLAALCLTSITPWVSGQFPDPFSNLNNWTVVGGAPQIDSSIGSPDSPSAKFTDTADGNVTFGKGTDSMYLSNPATTNFQDGTIDFNLYFDNDPQLGDVAVVTFRMFAPDTYYAALLSNSMRWSSAFVIVRQGQVSPIGSVSQPQLFATRSWSRVTLVINGPQFTALKDDQAVFSATDSSWSEGKWGGVGVYSEYYGGTFHIDNFGVENTSNPLTFVSPFTTTSTISSYATTSLTQTSTSVSVTVSTTMTTTTSAVIQGVVTTIFRTNTTTVGLLTPQTNWDFWGQIIFIGIGTVFAMFGDFNLENRSRVLEFLAILIGVIISVYVYSLGTYGLTWLWPLFIGAAIGLVVRKGWQWYSDNH